MRIYPVWRVQCAECKGWLSTPDDYVTGTDLDHRDLVVKPTALSAGMWPSWDAAFNAACNNGWRKSRCPHCI